MKFIFAALLTLTASLLSFASEAAEKFKLVHSKDVAGWMSDATLKTKLAIFDANNGDTRKKYGIVPGAKLLASSKSYDTKKVLPTDHTAKLVFYCANTHCMASHAAAERAVKAGYTDVNVLSDGIMGWKDAGQPTENLN